ncbi:MAG TPA: prephenate dehydratase [Acidimicrobiales bacterium]|nr:prephenate dehydratase [Acidimicrobiales bacterium]
MSGPATRGSSRKPEPAQNLSIAFLGPAGTFTEEALFTEEDFAAARVVPLPTIEDVLESVSDGVADLGFLPIENAIEGTVNATADSLIFDSDLQIQREVVIGVHLNLLSTRGSAIKSIKRLLSFPVATAQCRHFLAEKLHGVEIVPTNSTAEAAKLLSEDPRSDTAALGPKLAAELYGLKVLAAAVEDHPDNQTRFVAVAKSGIPAPTGHDKTSVVCFQRKDHPGSLHSILSEFSARSINLTKLESRPTKRALGDYCFLIDLEGHVADEVVADCLKVLHAELAGLKFLGSYPAAGSHGAALRRQVRRAWRDADKWVQALRDQVGNDT